MLNLCDHFNRFYWSNVWGLKAAGFFEYNNTLPVYASWAETLLQGPFSKSCRYKGNVSAD